MSGIRQHFIPQFLQKGFASHSNGDKFSTWVYRKSAQPFNTNIKKVGVESEFYSLDGDNQVDDEITAAEGRFGILIKTLRDGLDEATTDPGALAELIAHFEIRTRHIRQSFLATSSVAAEVALRFVEDPDTFGPYVRTCLRFPGRRFFRNVGVDGWPTRAI